MAKEAEANAEEDKKKRAKAEAKVGLDNDIYSAEKMKSDNAEKISEDDKKVLEEAVEEAKKVASKEDATSEELESAGKALTDKIMPIGAKMYESAAKETKDLRF